MEKIKQDLQPLFEVLPPWAKWIAMDKGGKVWCYELKPKKGLLYWVNMSADYRALNIYQDLLPQSYKDLHWIDSLIEVTKTKHKNTF